MKNVNKKLFPACFMLMFLFVFHSSVLKSQKSKNYNILILYNFGEYSQWGEEFTVSIRKKLNSDPENKFIYYVHNLDIGNDNPTKSPNYNDAVKLVSRHNYDVVVAMHSTTGRFVQYQKDKIFKDTFKVFVLPDKELMKAVKQDKNSSIIESASGAAISKTLDLVSELFPKNTGVIFISGLGMADSYYLSVAKNIVSEKNIKAEYILGKTIPEIIDHLNLVDKNKVVIFLSYGKDSNGRVYISSNAAKTICDNLDLPVMGFIGTLESSGILGGNLVSSKYYAEDAAIKIRYILGLKKDEQLNKGSETTKYYFDWLQLKKHNVKENKLPKDSIIVNKPESDLRKYFPYIIVIIIVLLLQLLFVVVLAISRSKLKRAKISLKSERDYNKKINETSPIGITTVDNRGHIVFANHEAEKILNLSPLSDNKNAYNDPEWKISSYDGSPFPENDLPFNQVKEKKEAVYNIRHAIVSKNGTRKLLSINASPILDRGGNFQGMLAVIQDSTDDVERKETIKRSLREKETLLRELYHRTKNNMQTICSLLNLQNRYSQSEEVKEQLQEAANRINSMALVHNKLYESKDLSNIPIKDYINDLVNLIRDSYHTLAADITFNVKIDDFQVEIDMAIQLGLIVNELISNSIKHAFEGKPGQMLIKMSYDKEKIIHLLVKDDGIGLPEDFDYFNTKSIGLQTITNIVKSQIGGEIKFNTEDGLKCEIQFEYKS